MIKYFSYQKIINYSLEIKGSPFARNTLTLALGTLVAQALPFLFYPILGRLYTPSEFGLLVTIQSVVQILAIFASGSFEQAILITESREEAAVLVKMILVRSFIICFSLFIILLVITKRFSFLIKDPILNFWLLFTPLIALSVVVFNCFNEWCVTFKYFIGLSLNKITNSSLIALSKVGLGITSFFSHGLVLGEVFGKLISAIICIFRGFKIDGEVFKNRTSKNELKSVSRKFIEFPKFLMFDQILNNIGGSIHIFFIAKYFSNIELGYMSMAASLLTVPVTVVSAAIKDVFRQRANIEYSTNGNCRPIYIKLLKPISIIAILFAIPLYFLLPPSFSFFLGDQWAKAALYAQIMVPLFVSNFISMSLGGILIISKKIRVSLVWQIYVIISTIIAFFIGIMFYKNIETTLILFTIARTSSYLLYMLVSFYYAKK